MEGITHICAKDAAGLFKVARLSSRPMTFAFLLLRHEKCFSLRACPESFIGSFILKIEQWSLTLSTVIIIHVNSVGVFELG